VDFHQISEYTTDTAPLRSGASCVTLVKLWDTDKLVSVPEFADRPHIRKIKKLADTDAVTLTDANGDYKLYHKFNSQAIVSRRQICAE